MTEREEQAITVLNTLYNNPLLSDIHRQALEVGIMAIKAESSLENPNKWIPVKWHEITDEEREHKGYPKDWACYLDYIMPYDGQRILITTKGGFVELDECYSDDGCTFSLDSGYDWIDDVVAWMPLPEPYNKQEVEEWTNENLS